MAAKETVPRGVIYCCVPLCDSYSGNGKAVKLHRLPEETKARRIWITRLRNVRQNFSAKFATCSGNCRKVKALLQHCLFVW